MGLALVGHQEGNSPGRVPRRLKLNKIINPCKESLDEALEYVYDEKGKIEPGQMGAEEGGGSALHGDHVIVTHSCRRCR
jgi:hypothetical protein